ncbi:unnamed protein product [Didymodactylos carnosus]|uniref:Uncharacterized protein n=1 Tax=Didymodactylos carnosus TaxID=1234261 RepID=A0A813VCJ8_9BILA|nr:unnamed protein product [Didymodactylos carnosus]CAF1134139.1 unnamed protein product [Didymodactylos carnosus]CAF3622988.1 unnamed protein product [Didymodactylos carnosus]CAF3921025.1 unnamed protein product [Didymodactylos carnosus]
MITVPENLATQESDQTRKTLPEENGRLFHCLYDMYTVEEKRQMSTESKDNQDEYHFNYEEVQALFNSVATSSNSNSNQGTEISTTTISSTTPRTTITYTPVFGGRSSTTRRSVRSRPPPPTYLNSSSFFRHAIQTLPHHGAALTSQTGGTNTPSPFNYSRSFRSCIRSRGSSYRSSFDNNQNNNHGNTSRINFGLHDNITAASTSAITGVIGGQPSIGSVTTGMSQVLAITTTYQPQPTSSSDLQRSTSVPNIIYLPATFALLTVNDNSTNNAN